MNASLQDRILAGAAAVLAAGSLVGFGWRFPREHRPQAGPVFSPAAFSSHAVQPPVTSREPWKAPPAQRRGEQWLYDVFTPPGVYYDAHTEQFSLTPPLVTRAGEPGPRSFGLELRRVGRKPYPLQLVGYAGGPGHYRGIFENLVTAETFLAAAGRAVPELGTTILTLDVRRMPLELPDSTTARPLVAFADVRDHRSGTTITLSSIERRDADAPVAWVAASDAPATVHEMREGETLATTQGTYFFEKIQLTPPTVDVRKEAADPPQSVRQTLAVHPSESAEPLQPPNS